MRTRAWIDSTKSRLPPGHALNGIRTTASANRASAARDSRSRVMEATGRPGIASARTPVITAATRPSRHDGSASVTRATMRNVHTLSAVTAAGTRAAARGAVRATATPAALTAPATSHPPFHDGHPPPAQPVAELAEVAQQAAPEERHAHAVAG